MSEKKEKVVKEGNKKEKALEESNEFKKIGEYIFARIKEYRFIMGLELLIFILLFFFIPQIMFSVKPYIWWSLFVLFTVVPTFFFYKILEFNKRQILVAIPIMFVLIVTVLSRAVINELYGISSRGSLDPTPAWLDAVFVTFIIIFFQYIGILLVDIMKKKKKKPKKSKE